VSIVGNKVVCRFGPEAVQDYIKQMVDRLQQRFSIEGESKARIAAAQMNEDKTSIRTSFKNIFRAAKHPSNRRFVQKGVEHS
jgi:hypothetical protein